MAGVPVTGFRVAGVDGQGRIGEHQVERLLGEGGQGAVYLARSPAGGHVAIKVLHERLAGDPEVRRRFLREAEVAASVAPFCTARVMGTGMLGERPYIVSEYVQGPSLDELVKRDGPRIGGGLDRLAISTLTALASIHRAGIVHRDFKPANVILGPEGPVVIDFGIARTLDTMTTTNHVAGTPAYMSPEQLGDRPLTLASDMFSWAATMVFAATGRRAFTGSNVPAVMHSVLHGPPDLSGVPEPLRTMAAACLAKDPADRPAADYLLRSLTAGDVRAAAAASPGAAAPGSAHLGTASPGTASPGIASPGAHLGTAPGDVSPGVVAEHTLVEGMRPPAASAVPTAPGSPDGAKARHGRSRRLPLAAAAVAVALAVTAGVLLVPSWTAANQGGAKKAAPLVIGGRTYATVDVTDGFDGTWTGYDRYQPFGTEALPVIKAAGGRLSGTSQGPFFGWFALPGVPSSGDAVSLITLGAMAGTGEPEDSVFVGRVKDAGTYIGAWYNNTRKESGIDVRVGGEFRHGSNSADLSLAPGDRLALVLSGGSTITSYAETGGTWRQLNTVSVDLPGTAEERARWRHGFALRGTTGTITLDAAEGRTAAG
ncbi:serine/threonine-protein kinase [Nonomuraea fuscirosea]|uniref:serine/threonine-protein kinase n=1 Tax=Nonomuraea fuscirosea TaxID=1291556 RepID=UPI00341BF29F